MILSRQTIPNEKPVDEIILLASVQRVLVLSGTGSPLLYILVYTKTTGQQVHFFTLPSLDPVNIKPIRHIICMAVDQVHMERPPPSSNAPVEPVHFCAIKRNAIGMYSIRGDRLLFMKVRCKVFQRSLTYSFQEIPLPNGAIMAKRSGFTLCIADKNDYQVIDLENASALPVIQVSQAIDPLPFIVTPSITVIDRSEFLLLSYTGASTLGLFITSGGDPVRGTLEWPQHPLSLSASFAFYMVLH